MKKSPVWGILWTHNFLNFPLSALPILWMRQGENVEWHFVENAIKSLHRKYSFDWSERRNLNPLNGQYLFAFYKPNLTFDEVINHLFFDLKLFWRSDHLLIFFKLSTFDKGIFDVLSNPPLDPHLSTQRVTKLK